MSEDTDIIVIGGGISGLGVALEACARGHRVTLIERNTLAHATSANSLRIIHGGLRYLQHLNVRRVLESANEQALLSKKYSDCFRPLHCVMPLDRGGMKSKYPMLIAAQLFKRLTAKGRGALMPMQVLGKQELEQQVPAMAARAPCGAFSWYDLLLLDHPRFVRTLQAELEQAGGVVQLETAVKEVAFRKNWIVRTEGGREFQAPVVVNATGPWSLDLLPTDCPTSFREFPAQWCTAINLELDFSLDLETALACQSQSGRLLFLVPRGEGAALGTWYYPSSAPARGALPRSAEVSEAEIQMFLGEARHAYGDARFTRSHVTGIDVGILPMKRCGKRGPELYGRHVVRDWKGFIHLMSTKYTTFRLLGEEAMKKAAPYL